MPTQNRIHEIFEYDADAGVLIWKTRPVQGFATVSAWGTWNTRYAGTVAGYITGNGYRLISVDGKRWWAHRLIWAYVNGPIPTGIQIDHINGVRSDNRLANLRLVTSLENGHNQAMPRNNTSGVMGVCWHKSRRRWMAQIKIDGRMKYLGLFDTLDDAAAARAKAEHESGFHEGHGKVVPSRLPNKEEANG